MGYPLADSRWFDRYRILYYHNTTTDGPEVKERGLYHDEASRPKGVTMLAWDYIDTNRIRSSLNLYFDTKAIADAMASVVEELGGRRMGNQSSEVPVSEYDDYEKHIQFLANELFKRGLVTL